jgi:hypothetical protein
MPTPEKGENISKFMNRCIPMVINEGTDVTSGQAYAICRTKFIEQSTIKEVFIDENTGVDKISLVNHPAIEYDFVAMSSDKYYTKQAVAQEDKHIITGPVLIPDQLIYRKDKDKEWYQYFSEDTIQQIVEKYFKQYKQDQVNLEHKLDLNDICMFESWIIKDTEKDKATALGFNLPVGTWMVSMKVNNLTVWDELIKKNLVNGFSIEGQVLLDTIKQSSDLDEHSIILEQIKTILLEIS